MKPKDVIIELFTLAEANELINFNTDDVVGYVISYASFSDKGEFQGENYKKRLKTFRMGLSGLFKNLNLMIDAAEGDAERIVQFQRQQIKKIKELPEYGLIEDNDKIIAFIRSLKPGKDLYNFSDVERLVGVTRQTLRKKIREGFLNIRLVYLNKSPLIGKHDVIRIYRAYNETDTFPF